MCFCPYQLVTLRKNSSSPVKEGQGVVRRRSSLRNFPDRGDPAPFAFNEVRALPKCIPVKLWVMSITSFCGPVVRAPSARST